MTCIIIEDQPPAQRILKKYIQDLGTLELKETFSSALEAIDFLRKEPVDLIFLDIHLPKISGLDFLGMIHNPPRVILTTAFPDYALKSYEFSVVDYLLKPFSFQRFVKAVTKVSTPTNGHSQSDDTTALSYPKEMFIKSGYEHIKLIIADILYIQSDADYTDVYLADKKYLSSNSLQQWEQELNPSHFIRVHRSHLVNMEQIQKFTGSQITLSNGQVLPIGRVYKEEFMKRMV